MIRRIKQLLRNPIRQWLGIDNNANTIELNRMLLAAEHSRIIELFRLYMKMNRKK